MESNKPGASEHAPLPPHVVDKLLDLLGSDDAFRSLFQADPAAALAQVGHVDAEKHAGKQRIARGETFYCMTSEKLASKEEILQTREALKDFLTAKTNHQVIHCFEAGRIAATLRSR